MLKQSNLTHNQIKETVEILGQKMSALGSEIHQSKISAENSIKQLSATAQTLSPRHQIRQHPYSALAIASLSGFLFVRWLNVNRSNPSSPNGLTKFFSNEFKIIRGMLIEATVRAAAKKLFSGTQQVNPNGLAQGLQS